MANYITLQEANEHFGVNSWANGDEAMAVIMANSWLTSQPLFNFEIIPSDIKLAGYLVAKAFANGEVFAGKTEATIVKKKVKADSVEVEKEYAQGDNETPVSKNMMMAYQLITPFLQPANRFTGQLRVTRG